MDFIKNQTTGSLKTILLLGTGNSTLGAYQQLYRLRKAEILSGQLKIVLVTRLHHHLNYGWLPECLSNIFPVESLLTPVEVCFPHAHILFGNPISVNNRSQEVEIALTDGQFITIVYDHLVVENEYFTHVLSNNKTKCGYRIQSTLDMVKTRKQLQYLVSTSCAAKDPISAARILRVAVGGDDLAVLELATNIATYIKDLLRTRCGKDHIQPVVYLITSSALFDHCSQGIDPIKHYILERIKNLGIKIITDKRVIRVNTDGAVLHDGSFINCSLVFNTNAVRNENEEPSKEIDYKVHKLFAIDKTLRAKGFDNIWVTENPLKHHEHKLPSPACYVSDLERGKMIGRNIIAGQKKRTLKTFGKHPSPVFANLGSKHGFAIVFGMPVTGKKTWLLRLFFFLLYSSQQNRKLCLNFMLKYMVSEKKERLTSRANQISVKPWYQKQLEKSHLNRSNPVSVSSI